MKDRTINYFLLEFQVVQIIYPFNIVKNFLSLFWVLLEEDLKINRFAIPERFDFVVELANSHIITIWQRTSFAVSFIAIRTFVGVICGIIQENSPFLLFCIFLLNDIFVIVFYLSGIAKVFK
jgi:hypothetical protein